MSHYTLGAHQAHVSQQYISDLLLVNHIITPHYRNLLCPLQILNDSLEVGDQVVVVVSMRSGQRFIKRCKAAKTAAGTGTILAK